MGFTPRSVGNEMFDWRVYASLPEPRLTELAFTLKHGDLTQSNQVPGTEPEIERDKRLKHKTLTDCWVQ